MKHLKMIGLGSVVAMVSIAFAASAASATTLEITGSVQNQAIKLKLSEKAETSMTLERTDGVLLYTCFGGDTEMTTTSFTGSSVTAPIQTWTTLACGFQIHTPGKFYIEHIAGTTDGTVFSEETEITYSTRVGTIKCKTGAGTHIGTLKGTASGNATLTINAVMGCGFLAPSVRWKAEWIVTSPHGLGVSA